MVNGVTKNQPFERSRPIGSIVALSIVIGGLLLVLAGSQLEDVRFLGGSLGAGLSNLGFTFLIIGPFQWLFDNRFREVFFRDIREEVRAAESIRDSGVIEVCADSRNVDFTPLISKATVIEIGVAFSDRLLKDYLQYFRNRNSLCLRVFFADASKLDLVAALAYMVSKSPEHIVHSARLLQEFLEDIEASGTHVERIPVTAISHYSFIRFDRERTFLTLSTYSSRRAIVPTFHLMPQTFLWQLVDDDIEAAEKAITCQPNLDESSIPWWRSLGRTPFTKKFKRGGQSRRRPV